MPIRPATLADLPAMRALELESPTAAHWTEQQYQSLFTAGPRMTLVLEEKSILQGFLVARILGQEGEIENIAVSLSLQRGGRGTSLLRELLHRARSNQVASVHLEVRESNAGARALYEKCGFRQVGSRARYYRDPLEDALLYRIEFLENPSHEE